MVAVVSPPWSGMWFNGSTGGGSPSATRQDRPGHAPAAGHRRHDDNLVGRHDDDGRLGILVGLDHDHRRAGGGSTTTTVAGGSTTATTSTPVVVGPATVLVPATQLTGDWTSPNFNIAGGTWNIGWAFACTRCRPRPHVRRLRGQCRRPATGTSTPAVTSSAAQGQSVTPQTSTGSQQVVVQAPAGCRWAIKVTGFSS